MPELRITMPHADALRIADLFNDECLLEYDTDYTMLYGQGWRIIGVILLSDEARDAYDIIRSLESVKS